jgi:hypothetical protein
MGDILTEELAAIRRIRMERLKELMRDIEERQRASNGGPGANGSGSDEASPETPPASSRPIPK